jgi:hypothetical protein
VSHASVSQPADDQSTAALRAQFDAEVRVAGLAIPPDDREHIFEMWANDLLLRERLRAADLALEEEPSFMQKPAQLGAGITPASESSGGAA